MKLEDQQIELMEQAEGVQKEVQAANRARPPKRASSWTARSRTPAARRESEKGTGRAGIQPRGILGGGGRIHGLALRATAEKQGRECGVGVQHGVCGGCHMKLPAQILVTCQAQQEMVTCINCGRILYYTRDMDLAVVD